MSETTDRIKERLGQDHFKKIGQKGGKSLLERYGPEYMSEIATRGGESLKKLHKNDCYFSEIGRKGGKISKRTPKVS